MILDTPVRSRLTTKTQRHKEIILLILDIHSEDLETR